MAKNKSYQVVALVTYNVVFTVEASSEEKADEKAQAIIADLKVDISHPKEDLDEVMEESTDIQEINCDEE